MTARGAAYLLIALSMTFYWYRVLVMARRTRKRIGKAANLIPPEPLGRALRVLWFPAVGCWVAHPYISAFRDHPPRALQPVAYIPLALVILFAVGVFAGMLMTRVCWKQMGRSWRMGIDPDEKTDLISTGAYTYVRHPIYALSISMMALTMLALPSPAMLAAAIVHIILMHWEARREEQHMASVHGDAYRAYCARVARFVPLWLGR